MRRKFELFMLWLIESIAKLIKIITVVSFFYALYIYPLLIFFNNNWGVFESICFLWILIIYPTTITAIVSLYYDYLKEKYKK